MLRNVCLYSIRQFYFEHDKLYFPTVFKKKVEQEDGSVKVEDKPGNQYVFNYTYLYHLLKDHECFRTETHPDLLFKTNTKVMKQMFIHVNREFSSWLMGMKAWGKDPEKFTGKPNMPYYSKKYFQTKFPKESISFTKEKGKAVLSMTNIVLDLPDFIGKDNICEVLISPEGNGFDIITSYKINDDVIRSIVKESKNFSFKKVKNEETDEIIVTNKDFKDSDLKVVGCDIGLNNLMALASNDKSMPDLLVNGRELKSVNQYYNKVKAQKTSELPKGLYSSKAIRKLTETRNHKINSMCHEVTKKVVDFLLIHGINCLVVGNNKGWKQEINIGKRNNQNFVSLPFAKVRNMLKYKCHLNGIIYLETEESYTSKCSFTDRESMSHQDDYKGKRIIRSLFKDSKGHIFNADIHGALNIIRKVFSYDVFKDDLISYVKKKIVKLHTYTNLIKNNQVLNSQFNIHNIKEKSVNPVLG